MNSIFLEENQDFLAILENPGFQNLGARKRPRGFGLRFDESSRNRPLAEQIFHFSRQLAGIVIDALPIEAEAIEEFSRPGIGLGQAAINPLGEFSQSRPRLSGIDPPGQFNRASLSETDRNGYIG
jgi:hypothetical protein